MLISNNNNNNSNKHYRKENYIESRNPLQLVVIPLKYEENIH